MCQLSYISGLIDNIKLKRIITTSLLKINANDTHVDGWGIFSTGIIIKNNKNALTNRIIIGEKITKEPIIAHVRKASYKFAQKKEIDHTHPFLKQQDNRYIILAHNGTLNHATENIPDGMIDSQFFLEKLFANYLKYGTFPDSFSETIKEFKGKFAFVIYSSGAYYIIRGKTADLHYTNLLLNDKEVGFIVNTEKPTLESTLNIVSNMMDDDEKLEWTPIELLPAETMFVVNNTYGKNFQSSMTKVNINFSETPDVVTRVWTYDKDNNRAIIVPHNDTTTSKTKSIGNDDINKIVEFATKYDISLFELDNLLCICTGHSILESNEKSLALFVDIYMPILDRYAARVRRKEFVDFLISTHRIEKDVYINNSIQFPVWLSSRKEIRKFLNKTFKGEITDD